MEYIIKGRRPENVFRFFEDICAIPHGSGNEKGIADYIEGFARSRGFLYTRDHVNNIFIKKSATAGRENEPPIMLQAHTDMVCEKNEGTEHDFLTDPLELYIEDGWLHARGTTLGGDDGIGVAIMLAILDGAVASHPTIECLFTTSEETGMDGVINFDFSQVSARRLVNLDAADISTVICGCAGGLRAVLSFDGALSENKKSAVTAKIGGLAGGHSGENINDGRANANKLMGRFLSMLGELSIVSVNGGGKVNAIPRECVATFAIDDVSYIQSLAASFEAEIKNELSEDDREFFVQVTPAGVPELAFSEEFSRRIVNMMVTVPSGVLKMSNKVKGLVEYSRNLGVIRTDCDKIEFLFLDRSGINAQLDLSCREFSALAELLGAELKIDNRYGGWDFAEKSPLREKYSEAFLRVMGKPAQVESIHAGLECGYIIEKIPDMDIISVAPNLVAIHSPDERLDLCSVEDMFKIINEMLAK
ncbi:MAG: aminoacyl-histidine dipeptidase [Ruminococcaceae bacterium]|nr:aminoacyl-histidine dipeptidase [Oscillospiraceae bacterium]